MVVLFDRARSFGRDAHGAVREEGDTRLASQISRINPGDQWGDRCRNQIALTSYIFILKANILKIEIIIPHNSLFFLLFSFVLVLILYVRQNTNELQDPKLNII